MSACRQCDHRNSAVSIAESDLGRMARVCARNPSPKNLKLLAAVKAAREAARQQHADHLRTEHKGEAA